MAWSHSSWLASISTSILLLAACAPDLEEGAEESGTDTTAEEDLQCNPGDAPPPCVGLDTEGCLSEPAGNATCTSGEWTCADTFTAPKLDPEESCATPPAYDCDADPPSCSDQSLDPDSCSDYVLFAPAFCVDAEWTCPPGYHDQGEGHCNWEGSGGA